MMEHAITKAIIFYLPQLIQSLRTDTDYQVAKFILSKCKCSQKIGHQFLWALKVEEQMAPKTTKRYLPKGYQEQQKSEELSQILRVKILKNLNIMQRKFWLDEDDIFGRICEVSGHFLHNEGQYKHLNLKMTKDEKTSFVRSELKKIDGKIQPYIYLPTNPNYRILNLLPDTAVTLQSAK
jgi:phosphatidylinositol 4-kinase